MPMMYVDTEQRVSLAEQVVKVWLLNLLLSLEQTRNGDRSLGLVG